MDKNGLYGFMLSVITDMELQGRYSTAHVYHCALKSAVGYGGTSLRIEDLSPVWLHNYQEHLLRQALLWNTISTYMRMLRALWIWGLPLISPVSSRTCLRGVMSITGGP